ncbi:unnamed protein product [Psylliodes chrysocephalus]|uniref:Cytochrome P450 n=1 Tax=Psylliodes chrysocephalus TaxID=3402493 RepID=A0A9P0CRW3_9CUCU|nr:unnamed protein product [Psylliodes chrysocephala]
MLLTSSWIPDLLLFFATISLVSYWYATRKFNYWKKRNVYYQKPVPFFGNFKEVITLKKPIGIWLREAYNAAKDTPYFGMFVFDEPYLVLKSPQLIKNVMIKDFNNFSDRTVASPEHDNVAKNFLFFMRNPEWKTNRVQLTPVFTSGKLKVMFPTVVLVCDRLQKYLADNLGVLEAKEVAAKFSTDVIAKTFFGINAHSFDDENAMFRVLGRKIFDFRLRNGLVNTAYFSMQNLVKLFRINFVEKWVLDYFTDSFSKAFVARENSKIRKNDFIDILIEIKKKDGGNGAFDMDKIKSAGMQFFFAGFETTSSTISYTLHELCLNKTIQNKVRQEILANMKENDGLTYEGVMGMKYLDMCVKETLRKYPVLPFLDRKCLNEYKLPGTDLVLEKGTSIYIPLFGLHYDEKYFPEPDKYDPERFANPKCNSEGLVYMPFGEGPRICIGERLGLITSKLGIISVLTKFEVERCAQTPDPVIFEAKSLVLQSTVGLPMVFKYITPPPA